MLYEDELADNGISILSVKIRVMPERLLILQRFFMRLDGVLFRLRDTRLFIEFETGEIVKQYQAREDTYANVRNVSPPPSSFSLFCNGGVEGAEMVGRCDRDYICIPQSRFQVYFEMIVLSRRDFRLSRWNGNVFFWVSRWWRMGEGGGFC